MKKTFAWIVFLSILIIIVSCSQETDNKNLKSGKLTIVYTGNIGGKINVCGCRPPLGGLARRATIINEIRNNAQNILILDSGALFYHGNFLYPPYDYTSRLIANTIKDVISDTGLDAFNVSSFDLANSVDSLLTFNSAISAKFLSANLVWKDSGELIFEPDAVYTVGEFRVGVFGLMSQKTAGVDLFKEDVPVRLLDPFEIAREEVTKLKKENDLVIALAYMDLIKVNELVKDVPGINVVIASHTRPHRPTSDHYLFLPSQVNNTIIVRCPDGGRVIGRLDLVIANGSTEFIDSSTNFVLKPIALREKKDIHEKSSFLNTFIDLGPEIESVRVIQDKVDLIEKRVEEYVQAYKESSGSK